jgi:hypothetical protein
MASRWHPPLPAFVSVVPFLILLLLFLAVFADLRSLSNIARKPIADYDVVGHPLASYGLADFCPWQRREDDYRR